MADSEKTQVFPTWAKALLIAMAVAIAAQTWFIARVTSLPVDETAFAQPSSQPLAAAQLPATYNQLAAAPLTTAQPAALPANTVTQAPATQMVTTNYSQLDPFSQMRLMHARMNQLMQQAMAGSVGMPGIGMNMMEAGDNLGPQIQVDENNKAYELTVDLPGADTSNIDVSTQGQNVIISARTDVQQQNKAQNGTVVGTSRQMAQFQQALTLPGPIDANAMTTTYDNGVLHVTIPKAGISS